MTKKIANVRVGKADVEPDRPAHTRGVRMGNQPGSIEAQAGIIDHGVMATAKGRRSTGINPERREPIDPNMPVLTPP